MHGIKNRKPLIAWAWATGLIQLGTEIPDGALPIARSKNHHQLREVICVLARHGYTAGQLLVPGIPEAPDQQEALNALIKFTNRVEHYLLNKGNKNGEASNNNHHCG